MTYIKQGQEHALVVPLPAAHLLLSAQSALQLVPVSTSQMLVGQLSQVYV